MGREQVKPGQLVWMLRAVVLLHALLVLAQALFAGQFLDDTRQALRWHAITGTTVVMSVALVHCVLALLGWRKRVQSLGFLAASAGLYVVEGAQIGFGFSDRLAVHVPLGVLIFGWAALLVFMAFGAVPEPQR